MDENLLLRIKELESLVEQQKIFIDQLLTEKQPYINPYSPYQPMIQGDCPAGGWHDYPTIWYGTAPPCCKKCGRQAPSFQPYYVSTTTSISTTDSNQNFTEK